MPGVRRQKPLKRFPEEIGGEFVHLAEAEVLMREAFAVVTGVPRSRMS